MSPPKDEINHVCFKDLKEYDFEVISLSYNQLFKLSFKLGKENEKLEKKH